jgi:hypothetical protein
MAPAKNDASGLAVRCRGVAMSLICTSYRRCSTEFDVEIFVALLHLCEMQLWLQTVLEDKCFCSTWSQDACWWLINSVEYCLA